MYYNKCLQHYYFSINALVVGRQRGEGRDGRDSLLLEKSRRVERIRGPRLIPQIFWACAVSACYWSDSTKRVKKKENKSA